MSGYTWVPFASKSPCAYEVEYDWAGYRACGMSLVVSFVEKHLQSRDSPDGRLHLALKGLVWPPPSLPSNTLSSCSSSAQLRGAKYFWHVSLMHLPKFCSLSAPQKKIRENQIVK
ncbi:Hypothetical protein, putative [Bodo saltans]|uniref:Uncharacterized protein n=1 Tax=Bodo saltans TaxID=75058 RepID=A0A0S4KF28_BODSA|nr:Hypothetical protein, putative [Bodo saltans]|eukprot:CUI14274.1 Hypothetical protein, putative [Bodo saltans]